MALTLCVHFEGGCLVTVTLLIEQGDRRPLPGLVLIQSGGRGGCRRCVEVGVLRVKPIVKSRGRSSVGLCLEYLCGSLTLQILGKLPGALGLWLSCV